MSAGSTLLRAAAVLAMAWGAHRLHQGALDQRADAPASIDVLYVPSSTYLRPMALGFREALADLLWVRALIYSGEHIGTAEIAETERYVDAVTGLSPRFLRAYMWGGITAVYGGQGEVTRDMVETAARIYRAGLAQFPESHELLYPYGMLLLTQVPSTPGYDSAAREAARQEGTELIRRAAAFGADPLVRQYAATLVTQHAQGELAIAFLESQLAQARDEDHRRMLRRKLSALAGTAATDSIDRTRRDFFEEHERVAPYMPEALYAVIRGDHGAGSAE